jgi:hypothetical protein
MVKSGSKANKTPLENIKSKLSFYHFLLAQFFSLSYYSKLITRQFNEINGSFLPF